VLPVFEDISLCFHASEDKFTYILRVEHIAEILDRENGPSKTLGPFVAPTEIKNLSASFLLS